MNFLSATPQTPAGASDWREVAGDYSSEQEAELQKRLWEGVDKGVIDHTKRCKDGKDSFTFTHCCCFGVVKPKPFEERFEKNPFNYSAVIYILFLSNKEPKPTKPLRISDHIPSTPKKEKHSRTMPFAYTKRSTQRHMRCERQKNYQRWLCISSFLSLGKVNLSS